MVKRTLNGEPNHTSSDYRCAYTIIFKEKAQEIRQVLLNENLDIIQIIPVLAEDYEIEDLGVAKAYGLDVLIKVMGEALPDELMDTLQHVQIACLEEKSAVHRQQ